MQNQQGNQMIYSTPCPLDLPSFTTAMLHMPTVILQILKIQDHKQRCINCNHGPLRDLIFKEETTPLIVACQYGELESVKIIVEDWGANVEATGVYYRDPKRVLTSDKIYRASPLFVAASCGHLEIVRYLVEKGANVTATTISNAIPKYHGLTPLLGAFFAHFDTKSTTTGFHEKLTDIVMILLEAGADPSALPLDKTPLWSLYGCRVEPDLIKALIHHGLDLNQRFTSPTPSDYARNITILHFFVGSTPSFYQEDVSFGFVKLLVEKGADPLLKDDDGFTPLLRAAYCEDGTRPNLKVLDFLLENDNFSRTAKIEAMELAGAIILSRADNALFPNAFDFWRRANQLRQFAKTPLQHENGKIVEWFTTEDLERVIQNPSKYKMQSFLVRLRILSSKSWGAHLLSLLLRNPSRYITGNFVKLLHLSWLTLGTLGRFDKDEPGITQCVTEATEDLVTALLHLGKHRPNQLTDSVIEKSLDFISSTDHLLFKDNGQVHETGSIRLGYHMKTLLRLVKFLVKLPVVKDETTSVQVNLKAFVQRARCDQVGQTLLHFACKSWHMSDYPTLPTIRFLLDSGADPTTVDVNGNAPLHVLAWFHLSDVKKGVAVAAGLLFKHGAHLCQANNSRKTAADVWDDRKEEKTEKLDLMEARQYYDSEDEEEGEDEEVEVEEVDGYDCDFDNDERCLGLDDPYLEKPHWLHDDSVPLLKCITARVIRDHNIPFSRLPQSLKRFVKGH